MMLRAARGDRPPARPPRRFRPAVVGLALLGCAADPPAPPPPGVADWVTALQRPDPGGWRHRMAVEALGRTREPKAVDALRDVVEAQSGRHEFFLRRLAVRALAEIGGARAGDVLARNLLRAEGRLRLEDDCRRALARIGVQAVPALANRLAAGGDEAVAAARALGGIGDPSARAALTSAQGAAMGPVRRAIDEALAAGAGMWEKNVPDSGVNQ